MSAWNEPELLNSTLKCNFCDQLKFDMTLRYYYYFFKCVKNHKMPAAFQLRVILITVVLFISMPRITTRVKSGIVSIATIMSTHPAG